MSDQPFDPGLQPERSALAWQRTTLSLLVGVLLFARVVGYADWRWAILALTLGAACVGLIVWLSRRRYPHNHRSLTVGSGVLADGALMALTAGFVAVAGLAALVEVLAA